MIKKLYWWFGFKLIFIIFFILSIPYYSGDVNNHVVWGESILTEGSFGLYDRYFHDFSFPNYPPLSMISFAIMVILYDLFKDLVYLLNNNLPIFPSPFVYWVESKNFLNAFLKVPGILTTIGTGYLIYLFYSLFKEEASVKIKILGFLALLLNPAVFYTSVIWGQNDMQQYFFILVAFFLMFKKRLYWAAMFAGLAIISKQTVLVLFVIFLITSFKLYGLKKSVIALIISITTLYLGYLPFNNTSLLWPFEFYNKTLTYSTGFLVSDNAINLWGSFTNFIPVDAGLSYLGIKFVNWGYILFALTWLPIVLLFVKNKFRYENFFLFSFLTSSLYFFLLTRMHERYLLPAVIFSIFLLYFGRKYFINYILITLIVFLNLYRGLYMPRIEIFDYIVINLWTLNTLVLIYLGVLVLNIYYFYQLNRSGLLEWLKNR